MRGNSLVLVDSKNRGKTIAYLPALCSRLQMYLDASTNISNKFQLTMGPKAIILCANASTVETIARTCRWLMRRNGNEVVHAIGSRNIRDVAVSDVHVFALNQFQTLIFFPFLHTISRNYSTAAPYLLRPYRALPI